MLFGVFAEIFYIIFIIILLLYIYIILLLLFIFILFILAEYENKKLIYKLIWTNKMYKLIIIRYIILINIYLMNTHTTQNIPAILWQYCNVNNINNNNC